MKRFLTILPLLAAAACSQPNYNSEYMGTTAGRDNAAARQGVSTSVLNPSSPAFFSQTVGDRVLFEVDQHSLTVAAKTVLDAQTAWLQSNPSYSVIIEGHADEQGTREYNLALGARRAQAVQNYLISKGISQSRLKTTSYGKERPVEVCSNASCYNINRRAVTVLSGGMG